MIYQPPRLERLGNLRSVVLWSNDHGDGRGGGVAGQVISAPTAGDGGLIASPNTAAGHSASAASVLAGLGLGGTSLVGRRHRDRSLSD